ncbi:MAG: cell filamentation protein Fic [Actinobacteria bacterium HGW-Actinobacteria-7]|nr:MAG: cell filamentation protein Fic [Actinobacteria bacterium HGW-Actinobacteria-7]
MGSSIRKRWISEAVSGVPRAERRSCEYDAYVPDRLSDRTFRLDGEVAADVADAEAAIARLDTRAVALTDTEALARILLRAESVASSRIEGLEIGPRRLMRAEWARQIDELPGDITAEEVLGNIDAMRTALAVAEGIGRITTDTLLEIHRCLLKDTRLHAHAGRVREVQNWIGGNEYNPCSAVYVPPPPEQVRLLLDDLSEFCNSDMLPAVAQAAIAHAQFETIHPFADGNGRTGRALIHLILRRRGLSTQVQPPVSLILATRAQDYLYGLTAFRFQGALDVPEAHAGLNAWIGIFSAACVRAVEDATAFESRCVDIEEAWRARLGRVRSGSSVDLLLRMLPGTPVLSVSSAMAALGRSKPQVNDAVARLQEAGILTQVTVGRRNRAFEAREVIDAFADLERQLASPAADTVAAPPVRPVPARRRRPSSS